MAGYSLQNDLCLLILLPANDAARKICNQIEPSSLCQIQMDTNHIEKGLIYIPNKQKSIKSEYDIQNNNASISHRQPSLKKFNIDKQTTQISRDLIKQRRVKINNKCLPLSSSPKKDSSLPHAFNLWYSNKTKSIFS